VYIATLNYSGYPGSAEGTSWTKCSHSCDGGKRTRRRNCKSYTSAIQCSGRNL